MQLLLKEGMLIIGENIAVKFLAQILWKLTPYYCIIKVKHYKENKYELMSNKKTA